MRAVGLEALIAEMWPSLSSRAHTRLAQYANFVRVWSPRMNLISASHERALIDILLTDAIVLATDEAFQNRWKQAEKIIDVGSGAGAPAIPFALLVEHVNLTLVEPRIKRVAFMNTVIGQFHLKDRVRVMPERIEKKGKPLSTPYDLALSRATFSPDAWLELGRELGRTVAVFRNDRSQSNEQPIATAEYIWPFSKTSRVIELW